MQGPKAGPKRRTYERQEHDEYLTGSERVDMTYAMEFINKLF